MGSAASNFIFAPMVQTNHLSPHIPLLHINPLPIPTHHDDVRDAVITTFKTTPNPLMGLLEQGFIEVIASCDQTQHLIWRLLERLTVHALDGMTLSISQGQDGQVATLWHNEDMHFVMPLASSAMDEQLVMLCNEALESLDALGRLYVLPGAAEVIFGDGVAVGYFTDAEAERLEAEGICIEMM